MNHDEWIKSIPDTDERIFCITRGCDRCGYYLKGADGKYQCMNTECEKYCRAEHVEWLNAEMDF